MPTTNLIGLEVHGIAFAFQHPRSNVNTITFYRFDLMNKNQEPIEDTYLGFFAEVDLGNFDDDYIGSDTLLHLGYVYNADNFDDDSRGYGSAPPALGYTFLRTATDPDGRDNDHDGVQDEPEEQQGMTSFYRFYGGGCTWCEPLTTDHYYYALQARWKDGQRITYGGKGFNYSDQPTSFFFPGDPITAEGWSEVNPGGDGSLPPNISSDRQFVISTGPFDLDPGEQQEIALAIVWSRGEDHLDSVRELKSNVAHLRRHADFFLQPDTAVSVEKPQAPDPVLGFASAYPNPFAETTRLRYSLPQPMQVRLVVYDLLGRKVAVLVDEEQAEGIHTATFDARGLPSGVYIARLHLDYLRFTKQLLVVR